MNQVFPKSDSEAVADLLARPENDSALALTEKLNGRQQILVCLALLSITFALYSAALYYGFVWDDQQYVVENFWIQNLSLHKLWEIWRSPYFLNYAPLHQMLFVVTYYFSGLEPFGYHLAQLLLHGTCVCLLYFVLQRLEGPRIAILASLLFVVYPANVETVAWVSESKSTLSLAFFLVSFWLFIRFRESGRWTDGTLSCLLLIFSLLSKVGTVVAPAIYLLYDLRQGTNLRKKGWSLVPFFLVSAIFSVVQMVVVAQQAGSTAPEHLIDSALRFPGEAPLPTSHGYYGGIATHLLNLPRLLVFYARMIVYPHPLTSWHMIPIYGRLNWAVGGAWLLLLAALALLWRSPRHIQFWGFWFLIFLAPVLQIIPNQIWVAERYLYIPVIGAFVLLSKLFVFLFDRAGSAAPKAALAALLVMVLFSYAWQTRAYLPAWRDRLSLFEDALPNCTTSAFCHYLLGEALLINKNGDSRGLAELQQAIELRPTGGYWSLLGETYGFHLGDYRRAHDAFQNAQRLGGGTPASLVASSAKTYYLEGDFPAASRLLDLGLQRNPNNSRLLMTRGFLLWKTGDLKNAKLILRRVLQINAENPLTQHPARFLIWGWDRPAEVGQLMHDLGNF